MKKGNQAKTCLVDDCNDPNYSKGYCKKHDYRIRTYGSLQTPREKNPAKTCSVKGCNQKHYAKGMCRNHYTKARDNDPNAKKCSVEDCNRATAAKGFCSSHYFNLRKYGQPIAPLDSTRPNICTVPTCNRRTKVKNGHCLKHRSNFERYGVADPEFCIIDSCVKFAVKSQKCKEHFLETTPESRHSLCRFNDCNELRATNYLKYCHYHWYRKKTYGKEDAQEIRIARKSCSVIDCKFDAVVKGMCKRHDSKKIRYGTPEPTEEQIAAHKDKLKKAREERNRREKEKGLKSRSRVKILDSCSKSKCSEANAAEGLCVIHYQEFLKSIPNILGTVKPEDKNPGICMTDKCSEQIDSKSKRLCSEHLNHFIIAVSRLRLAT